MKKNNDEKFLANLELEIRPKIRAQIREAECIGCTKCIQACPVDAITGSAKWMHVVIAKECTGCELCISPCPVDCIDMVPAEEIKSVHYHLERYHAHKKRTTNQNFSDNSQKLADRKSYILEAINRVKSKRNGDL